MQQFVTIFVLCGESGRQLFEESDSRLTKVGLDWDRDKSLANGQLAYWINFLDAWSMGDSFDRFLSPANELKRVNAGSHQLVCCRRENVRIKSEPRSEEEARLRQILTQAQEAYQGATSESYLFQVRSVFTASDGFNPEAQQAAP
jgi:hypothetical protein